MFQQPRAASLDALDDNWPGLRADVALHPVEPEGEAEAWVLEDPVSGRYFRLGQAEAILVRALREGKKPSAVVASLRLRADLPFSGDAVCAFMQQLREAGLCRGNDMDPGRPAAERGFWKRLLHGYVYYRVPLVRPDAWLARLVPWVQPLASPQVAALLRYAGLLGLLLAIPQAQLYFATASYLLTPSGFLSFVACLVLLKIGHELAHAFSAKLKRLHVRSMGVAFILLWPILYTDVTDAWREPDRRRRARIGAAGIRFELAVAGMALLLWSILPDGVLRSLAFYLSSASILSSLLINLNPFMRFDGYFLLMDVWGIDNLQPRAFALLRHRLRKVLLGWRGQAPESHPHAGLMCAYAAATMAYRVFVASVIAVAVFKFIGAIAGLIAAALEIYILILRPVIGEVRHVYRQRLQIGSPVRLSATLATFALAVIALLLPLDRSMSVPAVLTHERLQYVSTPFAGRLAEVPPAVGTRVETGQVLLVVDSLEGRHELERIELELQRNQAERQALDTRGSEGGYRRWLEEDERRLLAARSAAESRVAQRAVRATAPGVIIERDPDFRVGDTVAAEQVLATTLQSARLRVQAFVEDTHSARLDADALVRARLHPWDTGLAVEETPITDAQLRTAESVASIALFDRFGGPLPAVHETQPTARAERRDDARSYPLLKPRDGYQIVSFTVDAPTLAGHIPDAAPAWVELQLKPVSLIGQTAEFLARSLSR